MPITTWDQGWLKKMHERYSLCEKAGELTRIGMPERRNA